MAMPLYDTLGVGYSTGRQQDPRIADVILRAIGDTASIVNVGAGSGSYEPSNTRVVAVEPSQTMMRQRPMPWPLLVRARAEGLPFHDGAFDCALAILTIHHWSPVREGLRELGRVARKAVILSWDQESGSAFGSSAIARSFARKIVVVLWRSPPLLKCWGSAT